MQLNILEVQKENMYCTSKYMLKLLYVCQIKNKTNAPPPAPPLNKIFQNMSFEVCLFFFSGGRGGSLFGSPEVKFSTQYDIIGHIHRTRETWLTVLLPTCQGRVLGELAADGGASSERAKAERNVAAEAFLAVSEAGVRALASPCLGLKIGPAEIERYITSAVASVPWTMSC